jgi:hypothetical protein
MLKSAENQVDNADKKEELKDKALALSIKVRKMFFHTYGIVMPWEKLYRIVQEILFRNG